MWQVAPPTINNKHQTTGYHSSRPSSAKRATKSSKRATKSTKSTTTKFSKYKYSVPTKQYGSSSLKETSALQSIMAPHPPITLPSLHNNNARHTSTQSAFTYSANMQAPEQISANSHTEEAASYDAFPSSFQLFCQIASSPQPSTSLSLSSSSLPPNRESRKRHKRSRTKVRLQQSSIPPPPQIGSSQSVPPKAYRDRSRSLTNSSYDSLSLPMQPIPEHSARFASNTTQSNDVLIEVDEELDELEEERMKIKHARKRLSISRSVRSDRKSNNNLSQDTNKVRSKNKESDSFWEHNRKIPFIGLAMATSTFFILVFIYFTNLFRFLFGGLVPCLIGLIMIVPIYYFFRKYDRTLQYKSVVIQDHIMQEKRLSDKNSILDAQNNELTDKTEDLTTRLLNKLDIIRLQKTHIRDLNEHIAARKAEHDGMQSQVTSIETKDELCYKPCINNKAVKKCSLLKGFVRGEMEAQLEMADINDLVNMLPIVTSCITLMPFGMSQTRKKLQRILESKISNNPFVKMRFYFFLVSYLGCLDVQRLFRKHKMMKSVNETANYYKYSWEDMMEKYGYLNHGDRVYSFCASDDDSVITLDNMHNNNMNNSYMQMSVRSPTAALYCNDNIHNDDDDDDDAINEHNEDNKDEDDAVIIECEETVVFNEKDPVKLFRMPLDRHASVGFTVLVANKLQDDFYDPINGTACVEQLKVRKIFNSNARPYLIDCYVKDAKTDAMHLSCAYILKRGDDLRKDGAVLKMFEFMNFIWRTNELKYRAAFVSSLIYKCIPMGPDVGIIEVIPNCIELNKVMSLRHKLQRVENIHLWNKLVASSAGAFIAAFVMGIRDRHDDNILINVADDGYSLFHIDFGYMFGDRAPALDTAKLAITSGLKNVFDIYDCGWNDFIDICIKSWLILRNNANQLIDYARVVFAFLYQTNEIEVFLRDSLKLDIVDDDIAAKYIHDKLKNAPKHLKTKVKNLVHGFAQKIK